MTDGVKKLARALCREKCAVYGEPPCFTIIHADGVPAEWPAPECGDSNCINEASAAIAALEADGWRKIGPDEMVVPREPTEKMIDAGVDVSYHQSVSRIYRAMIAAKGDE